jgi:hypothetical protein
VIFRNENDLAWHQISCICVREYFRSMPKLTSTEIAESRVAESDMSGGQFLDLARLKLPNVLPSILTLGHLEVSQRCP